MIGLISLNIRSCRRLLHQNDHEWYVQSLTNNDVEFCTDLPGLISDNESPAKVHALAKGQKKKRIVTSDDEEETAVPLSGSEAKAEKTHEGGHVSYHFMPTSDQLDTSPPAKKTKTSPAIASIFTSPSKPKAKSNGNGAISSEAKHTNNEPSKPASKAESSKAASSSIDTAKVVKDVKAPKAGPSKSKTEAKPIASIFAKPLKKEKVEEPMEERHSPVKDDMEGEDEIDDESEDEQEEEAAVKLCVQSSAYCL